MELAQESLSKDLSLNELFELMYLFDASKSMEIRMLADMVKKLMAEVIELKKCNAHLLNQ